MVKQRTIGNMLDPGVIAIARSSQAIDLEGLAGALYLGGIRAVEMTLTTPGAIESIRTVSDSTHEKMAVGVGSVLNLDQAKAAMDAGAQFVVTPILERAVVAECEFRSIPVVCGAFTATEAQAAHEALADFVKIFPADSVGPGYIRALLAPLPHLKIIPTGGVTVETCASFFKVGCVAVAAGSSLLSENLLVSKDWKRVTERTRTFVAVAKKAKM